MPSHAEVVDLQDEVDWVGLHRRFTAHADQNFGPWNRCMTVAREVGAKGCVIEHHYLCLDYKSELLAFYSQLDASRELSATRLHFFQEPIREEELHILSNSQIRGYLGYVICREGNLPLVGRSNLHAPSYVGVVSDIIESVHFFGQELQVQGVPFIQQDGHFSVCSQVAVWAAHYTMHRLGLVQRRLVAEIVAMSGTIEPMKPRASEGLFSEDVSQLFRRAGLGSRTYFTEGDDLPIIHLASVPGARAKVELALEVLEKAISNEEIQDVAISDLRDPEQDVAQFAADLAIVASQVGIDHPVHAASNRLFDLLLAYILEPYMRSRYPIYAGTANHAMLFCGMTRRDDRVTFFVHDDQYGPYLAIDSLLDGSRSALASQGYDSASYPAIRDREIEFDGETAKFPVDVAKIVERQRSPLHGFDTDRAVEVLIVPGPTRLLLTPAEAEADAYKLLQLELAASWANENTDVSAAWHVRSTILMGIDYKRLRRTHLLESQDVEGARIYSSIHLAEWVIVLEQVEIGSETSAWEIVYDGTSGGNPAVTQFARFGRRIVAEHPLAQDISETGELLAERLPHIIAPTRIGKMSLR